MTVKLHDALKSVVVSAGAGGDDAQAVTGRGMLYGFVISGAEETVQLWDATAASGQQLSEGFAFGLYALPVPMHFSTGIFVVMAANQIVTVLYQDQSI